jgi:hypothetical protein
MDCPICGVKLTITTEDSRIPCQCKYPTSVLICSWWTDTELLDTSCREDALEFEVEGFMLEPFLDMHPYPGDGFIKDPGVDEDRIPIDCIVPFTILPESIQFMKNHLYNARGTSFSIDQIPSNAKTATIRLKAIDNIVINSYNMLFLRIAVMYSAFKAMGYSKSIDTFAVKSESLYESTIDAFKFYLHKHKGNSAQHKRTLDSCYCNGPISYKEEWGYQARQPTS